MRVNIIGAGPAGLYFAYLMKRRWPTWRFHVIEQNADDDTFGFGVVLSGRALSFLAEADAGAVARLGARMQTWADQHIVLNGERVVIDGSAYSAIARIVLLRELQAMCRDVGVTLEFRRRAPDPADFMDCDMLVGADGANSVVRATFPERFSTRVQDLQNYFAWYGVACEYPAHTLTFLSHRDGAFCGHHYRYAPGMSTFVAEVDTDTWHRSGMAQMDDEARRHYTQTVFAQTLNGLPLIDNRSQWKRLRLTRNDRWSCDHVVLIGDALRTAHYSIGSGTRLAIEDSIALWRAFDQTGDQTGCDIATAFARYAAERAPVRDKLNRAAELSIAWYEAMASKMTLPALDFVWDYMMRTGVMTPERLERESPRFMARWRARQAA